MSKEWTPERRAKMEKLYDDPKYRAKQSAALEAIRPRGARRVTIRADGWRVEADNRMATLSLIDEAGVQLAFVDLSPPEVRSFLVSFLKAAKRAGLLQRPS